jgi:hypothetical protein
VKTSASEDRLATEVHASWQWRVPGQSFARWHD